MSTLSDHPVACYLEIDDLLHSATRDDCLAAASAVAELHRSNIAVVLCSGATRGELDYLAKNLELWHPFIAEDGSAICVPGGYFAQPLAEADPGVFWEVIEFGRTRRAVVDTIEAVADRLQMAVLRLSELTPAGAAAKFGLSRPMAARAVKRTYGDVVRLVDDSDFSRARFVRALQAEGLKCTQRGDAIYAVSNSADGRAVQALQHLFQECVAGVQAMGVSVGHTSGLLESAVESVTMQAATLSDAFERVRRLAVELQIHAAERISPDRRQKYPVFAR